LEVYITCVDGTRLKGHGSRGLEVMQRWRTVYE
jgi:hypothetical protein